MMGSNSIALQVEGPDFANSFSKGVDASQGRQMNSLRMDAVRQDMQTSQDERGRKEALQLMEMLGSAGMYALNGDMNGTPDPAKWDEAMDGLAQFGLDAAKYKGKAQMAPVLVSASMSAADRIKMARDDREFALTLEKLDADLNQHAESMGMRREALDIQRQRLDTVKNKKTPLSATAQKELFEADESVQAGAAVISALDQAMALNDKAYSGPMADTRGWAASQIGSEAGVATQDLKNIVTGQALENLKAVFGGMPTEGERKILLEIQGSVDQAPEVRKGIFERGKAMALRRIEFNKQKAAQLRSGEYFSEQGPSGDPDTAADETANDAAANRQVIDGITYEQDEAGEWFEVE